MLGEACNRFAALGTRLCSLPEKAAAALIKFDNKMKKYISRVAVRFFFWEGGGEGVSLLIPHFNVDVERSKLPKMFGVR